MSLLDRIRQHLETDERVSAAWLAGSRGRGTDDDLSDIDIWVAVEDDAIGTINADPLAFAHEIASTLIHIQAPSISPPGGVYLLTWIELDGGFEQVDWYWTPASTASRPSATELLFERQPVPIVDAPEPERLDEEALVEDIEGTIKHSLLMVANAWKHGRRGDHWRVVAHIQHVNDCFAKLDWLITYGRAPAFHDPKRSFLPETIPMGRDETCLALRGMLVDLTSLVERADRRQQFHDAIVALTSTLEA